MISQTALLVRFVEIPFPRMFIIRFATPQMDIIQGLFNPNGRLNVEKGLNTKLTGLQRHGRGRMIGTVPTAAMLNGTLPATQIFPTDLEKGWGDWMESREKWNMGPAGGRCLSVQSMTNQFYAYLLLLLPPLRRTARSPRHHKIPHHIFLHFLLVFDYISYFPCSPCLF